MFTNIVDLTQKCVLVQKVDWFVVLLVGYVSFNKPADPQLTQAGRGGYVRMCAPFIVRPWFHSSTCINKERQPQKKRCFSPAHRKRTNNSGMLRKPKTCCGSTGAVITAIFLSQIRQISIHSLINTVQYRHRNLPNIKSELNG